MLRVRRSIVCDYCERVFCDEMDMHDFKGNELPSKFQEAENSGWEISPEGDFSAHVLCDKCKKQGATCLDICDKNSSDYEVQRSQEYR